MYDAIVLGTGGIGRARLWGLDRVPAPGPGLAAEGRAQGPALVPPGIPDDAPVYLYETPGGVFYGFPPDAQGRNKVVEHTGGRPHPPAILARPLSPTRRDTHVGRYPIPPSWCRDFGQIGTLADCDTLGLSLHRTDRHPRRLRHPRFVTPPDRSAPSQTATPPVCHSTGQIDTLADCDTLGLSLHRTDRHARRLRTRVVSAKRVTSRGGYRIPPRFWRVRLRN